MQKLSVFKICIHTKIVLEIEAIGWFKKTPGTDKVSRIKVGNLYEACK